MRQISCARNGVSAPEPWPLRPDGRIDVSRLERDLAAERDRVALKMVAEVVAVALFAVAVVVWCAIGGGA